MEKYLRKAVWEDIDLLFEWANDKQTRSNAFSPEPIPYETHRVWFANMMKSTDVLQYIYYNNEVPIGQVRLNLSNNRAYLDYSISPMHRGQGHAGSMLKLLEDLLRNNLPHITELKAQIKEDNSASIKVVETLNYQRTFVEYTKQL